MNRTAMSQFVVEIQAFGDHFADMQRYRHFADYAPVTDFERSRVTRMVEQTAQVIAEFNRASNGDRRAFALHVLLRNRRD